MAVDALIREARTSPLIGSIVRWNLEPFLDLSPRISPDFSRNRRWSARARYPSSLSGESRSEAPLTAHPNEENNAVDVRALSRNGQRRNLWFSSARPVAAFSRVRDPPSLLHGDTVRQKEGFVKLGRGLDSRVRHPFRNISKREKRVSLQDAPSGRCVSCVGMFLRLHEECRCQLFRESRFRVIIA